MLKKEDLTKTLHQICNRWHIPFGNLSRAGRARSGAPTFGLISALRCGKEMFCTLRSYFFFSLNFLMWELRWWLKVKVPLVSQSDCQHWLGKKVLVDTRRALQLDLISLRYHVGIVRTDAVSRDITNHSSLTKTTTTHISFPLFWCGGYAWV